MHNHREAYEEILKLIESIDVNGDSIVQAMKLRAINEKLRANVKDEKQLTELFEMLNGRALLDEGFIMSLVCTVTSVQCSTFAINGKLLRHAMLTQLQKNHQNADNMKKEDVNKLYNSIRLLGEFYNKARLQSGSPISIIGKAMLGLINVELEKELRNICHFNSDKFARTILSQITLNGKMLQNRQRTDIEQVLLTIRKCLIELPSLTPKTKAFLLMIVDLYYCNFMNVGHSLERMYQEFLIEDKIETKSSEKIVQNGNAEDIKRVNEKEKAQKSLERMTISKKPEPTRTPKTAARNLRVEIGKHDPIRSAPASPHKSVPTTPKRSSSVSTYPLRSSSVSTNKDYPRSPSKTSPQNRSVPQSPKSPQGRSASTPPRKKLSPQELRAKRSSPPSANHSPKAKTPVDRPSASSEESAPVSLTNGNDENILRQQNARSTTPSTPTSTPKLKTNSKVYFREENVENLTWNGETSADIEGEDPDASTSPKVNPYSSSFLSFLSSN